MQTVRIQTSQNVDIDYEVASLGDRVLGRLVDIGVAFGLAIVLIILAALTSWNSFFGITLIVVYVVAFVFYDLACEVFFNGQSLGKRVMKIKVISIDGGRPSLGQYLLRWLFRIIDFGIGSGVVALIAVAVSEKQQRVGDMVAGTTLIKTVARVHLDGVGFMPTTVDTYTPVYTQVIDLSDQDVALIHEVMANFNKTGNSVLIYNMATRIREHLGIAISSTTNDYQFLQIIIKDYNHITAAIDA